jgi:hypothetical protein
MTSDVSTIGDAPDEFRRLSLGVDDVEFVHPHARQIAANSRRQTSSFLRYQKALAFARAELASRVNHPVP